MHAENAFREEPAFLPGAALIAPVAHYLETTATRVPFSDWYETVTGEYCHFMGRSVQGGIFMPVLMKKFGQ